MEKPVQINKVIELYEEIKLKYNINDSKNLSDTRLCENIKDHD